jgi:hypothetical protein
MRALEPLHRAPSCVREAVPLDVSLKGVLWLDLTTALLSAKGRPARGTPWSGPMPRCSRDLESGLAGAWAYGAPRSRSSRYLLDV